MVVMNLFIASQYDHVGGRNGYEVEINLEVAR